MKVQLSIKYLAQWGQTVYVYGTSSKLGNSDKNKAIPMNCTSNNHWTLDIDIDDTLSVIYRYVVKNGDKIIRLELVDHSISLNKKHHFYINDLWLEEPKQKFLYTSGFSNSFFAQKSETKINYYKNTILLKVRCPYVLKNQCLILCGASDYFGNWNGEKALRCSPLKNGEWYISIDSNKIDSNSECKFAIYDNTLNRIIHWDRGENQVLCKHEMDANSVNIETFIYDHEGIDWRAAGVSIPVFALRTEDSFGIGDFYDLRKMIDWAAATGQKIVQILPVNDTTSSYTWKDSYPYNAISIYALHPLYLGFKEYPLKNNETYKLYSKNAEQLNSLDKIDYERVGELKRAYLRDLFAEVGEIVLNDSSYHLFYHHNEKWLYPYACFCYLRDEYQSAELSQWGKYSTYNKSELDILTSNSKVREAIHFTYFTQYLLHKQLTEIKEYAHLHGIILKGDIPIGINSNSVEAWTEPHLFNLDVQTGAPPDDFSVEGQNWGFPTYNWDEMAKDGYAWWIKRFRKMADYFDAYRIDHILGFFRIWEIPLSAVQGLLGYFSPALPFSVEELNAYGLEFDENRMLEPYIHENYLTDLFGDYTQEVIDTFLHTANNQQYKLNEEYNTQQKIKQFFEVKNDEKSLHLKNGLYHLCSEVLFVRDKHNPQLVHPRISVQSCYTYKDLNQANRYAFDALYENFFYHRHSEFWRSSAMHKLPTLISSTQMLVCGEDLGMIPDCVPSVMNELQILSLEIERMPKESCDLFARLSALPYMSVCTTSTHDMSPIRAWWKEDKSVTQQYYNDILWKQGIAPNDCTSTLCWQILMSHLNSPSMLTILPLQDWLSINDQYKKENHEDERINVPAIADFYWQYRMHLNLEDLIKASDLNEEIRNMLQTARRH